VARRHRRRRRRLLPRPTKRKTNIVGKQIENKFKTQEIFLKKKNSHTDCCTLYALLHEKINSYFYSSSSATSSSSSSSKLFFFHFI
jgi:hypothetical protein